MTDVGHREDPPRSLSIAVTRGLLNAGLRAILALRPRRTYDVILDELLTEKTGLAEAVLAPASMAEDELAGRFKREFGEVG